jgi:hypothetical protein
MKTKKKKVKKNWSLWDLVKKFGHTEGVHLYALIQMHHDPDVPKIDNPGLLEKGKIYFKCSAKDYEQMTGFGTEAQKWGFPKLIERGVIRTRLGKIFPPVRYIRIMWKDIQNAMEEE